MAVKALVRSNRYRDSIFLMKLSAQAARESGAEMVSAMMATDRNKELFEASGLATPEILAAKANDLVIAIKADAANIDAAADAVARLLEQSPAKRPAAGREGNAPALIRRASLDDSALNLALISVAGDYARYEAAEALSAGMDVMLYSDNISLADELALKRMAWKKKLMVMGPDCGTSIIDGTPLAFANNVARGAAGIVGASGTGLQEVCCLLDRMGVGVSQAYGAGGRDLKDEIGGLTALTALKRLAADPLTTAIIILGKPPGNQTRKVLLEYCQSIGKPVFVHYIGAAEYIAEKAVGFTAAADLTELSVLAARYFNPSASLPDLDRVQAGNKGQPGFLCGIFGGGTLCLEAAILCEPYLKGDKRSNLSISGYKKITGKDTPAGHVFWDLGEDEFTVGRPHPMMAPDLKMERLAQALLDPDVGVILMDMVIGYGSHPEQGRLAVETLARAESESGGKSREKTVIASVCGTEKDVPSRSSEVELLRGAGVAVFESNALAARRAADCAGEIHAGK